MEMPRTFPASATSAVQGVMLAGCNLHAGLFGRYSPSVPSPAGVVPVPGAGTGQVLPYVEESIRASQPASRPAGGDGGGGGGPVEGRAQVAYSCTSYIMSVGGRSVGRLRPSGVTHAQPAIAGHRTAGGAAGTRFCSIERPTGRQESKDG